MNDRVRSVREMVIPSTRPSRFTTGPPTSAGEPIVVVGEAEDGSPTSPGLSAALAERDLTPGGVTVIDAVGYRERKVTNLGEALRYAPGVFAVSDSGSQGTFLSIRGSNLDSTPWDGNGVKLLQDGLPVTTADVSWLRVKLETRRPDLRESLSLHAAASSPSISASSLRRAARAQPCHFGIVMRTPWR